MRDKVALITGASVGIGRAVALKMAKEGAKLVLLDYNEETLCQLKEELATFHVEYLAFVCDVSNEEEVKNCTAKAFEKFGKIDILINNAALWRVWEKFLETPNEKWKQFFDINVMGVVYCTRAVLPKMLEQGYGRIVNVASVAGVYGNASMVVYSATKGAIISMSQALAKEVADKGVVVNCVSPGTVSDSSNRDLQAFKETDMCYLGRTGTGEENADLICFLASENNGYIIGQNIQIDGCRKKI